MLVEPNQALTTVDDIINYLFGFIWTRRRRPIESDFDLSYERGLNYVMDYLMHASREAEGGFCAECVAKNQTLTTVQDVLDYLSSAVEDMRAYPFEDDLLLGYQSAFRDLMHMLWSASPEPENVLNAPTIRESSTGGAKVVSLADARRDGGNQG